jgi:hypothetical protein
LCAGHQGGPDNLLEMTVGDLRIVVPIGEDLPLLGHAQPDVHGFRGKGQYAPGCGSPASPERPPAAVEEYDPNAFPLCDLMERTLRFVQSPVGRKVSAVLRAVRVADHDDLRRSLAAKVGVVGGIPQHPLENLRRLPQVLYGFKERNDAERAGAGRFTARTAQPGPAREPQHGENVAHVVGHADDVIPHGLRTEGAVHGAQEAEKVAGFPAFR